MNSLEEIWNVELKILSEVDKICKKYGINYFADSGTLLGAVRHNGFIPWDDDIDLAMFRDDFDRFRKIAEKELPNTLFCQSGYNDKGFYGGMLHIRMNNTTAIQIHNFPHMKYHQGVFIDIFPLDGVIENRIFKRLQNYLKSSLNVVMWYKNYHSFIPFNPRLLILKLPAMIPQKLLFRMFEKVCSIKKAKKSKFVDAVSYFGTSGVYARKAELYNAIYLQPFENTVIPIPQGYDEVLKGAYGKDYMTPRRVAAEHGDVFFDLHHSYKDYLNGTLFIPEEFYNNV